MQAEAHPAHFSTPSFLFPAQRGVGTLLRSVSSAGQWLFVNTRALCRTCWPLDAHPAGACGLSSSYGSSSFCCSNSGDSFTSLYCMAYASSLGTAVTRGFKTELSKQDIQQEWNYNIQLWHVQQPLALIGKKTDQLRIWGRGTGVVSWKREMMLVSPVANPFQMPFPSFFLLGSISTDSKSSRAGCDPSSQPALLRKNWGAVVLLLASFFMSWFSSGGKELKWDFWTVQLSMRRGKKVNHVKEAPDLIFFNCRKSVMGCNYSLP